MLTNFLYFFYTEGFTTLKALHGAMLIARVLHAPGKNLPILSNKKGFSIFYFLMWTQIDKLHFFFSKYDVDGWK